MQSDNYEPTTLSINYHVGNIKTTNLLGLFKYQFQRSLESRQTLSAAAIHHQHLLMNHSWFINRCWPAPVNKVLDYKMANSLIRSAIN